MSPQRPRSTSPARRLGFLRRRAVWLPIGAIALCGLGGGLYLATTSDDDALIVAGERIDQGLMRDMVDESMEIMKGAPVGSAPEDEQRANIQDLVAVQLSTLALLRREARERNITITDNDLRRARADMGVPDDVDMDAQRMRTAVEFHALRAKFRQVLLREDPPDLSAAAVKRWYVKHRSEFHTPRRRTVFAVETTTRQKAEAVIRGAEANEPLAELFERHADRTSATYASRGAFTVQDGTLSPTIVEAVMSAPDRRWVGPLRSGKRWLIVFTSDSAQEATTLSLADSRATVKEAILNRHADGLWQDFVAELRRKYAGETKDPKGQLPVEITAARGADGPTTPPEGFGPDDPPPPPPEPSPKAPEPPATTEPAELIPPPPAAR